LDDRKELVPLDQNVAFEPLKVKGSMLDPYILSFEEGIGGEESGLTITDPYPNPFSVETHITYRLVGASEVRFRLYNNLGQVIRSFSEKHEGPGEYTLTLKREDLLPGLYFFQMEAVGMNIRSQQAGRIMVMD